MNFVLNFITALLNYSLIFFALKYFGFLIFAKVYSVICLTFLFLSLLLYLSFRIINPKLILYHFAQDNEWNDIIINGFNKPTQEGVILLNKYAFVQAGKDLVSFIACGNIQPVIDMKIAIQKTEGKIQGYEFVLNFNDIVTIVKSEMVKSTAYGKIEERYGSIYEATVKRELVNKNRLKLKPISNYQKQNKLLLSLMSFVKMFFEKQPLEMLKIFTHGVKANR